MCIYMYIYRISIFFEFFFGSGWTHVDMYVGREQLDQIRIYKWPWD